MVVFTGSYSDDVASLIRLLIVLLHVVILRYSENVVTQKSGNRYTAGCLVSSIRLKRLIEIEHVTYSNTSSL